MIPVTPTMTVRAIEADDHAAVQRLLNASFGRTIYSLPLDGQAFREQVLHEPPPTHYNVTWRAHRRLGAWRAGELLGFMDFAVGHDRDHVHDDANLQGLLRYVAIADDQNLGDEAFRGLMNQAEAWWREQGATHAVAFHISTGYPNFQVGGGVLPGEWSALVRLLTSHDWRFAQRYYALMRSSGAPLEEEYPYADLSLVQQRLADGRTYRVYHRRVESVAHARVAGMTLDLAGAVERVAHLVDLEVDEEWRNRNLGKWLLRRVLNDAALQGFQEIVAFVPMSLPIALNLLVQQGFLEMNYRGYTFEKPLTP